MGRRGILNGSSSPPEDLLQKCWESGRSGKNGRALTAYATVLLLENLDTELLCAPLSLVLALSISNLSPSIHYLLSLGTQSFLM